MNANGKQTNFANTFATNALSTQTVHKNQQAQKQHMLIQQHISYASQTDNGCCRLFAVASLWTVTHRLNLSPLPFPHAPSHLLSCGLTN